MQSQIEINKRFVSQLPTNLIANIAFFIINVIIGIALVPYFISTLGIAAYGLIPLATSITGYVAIVVQSINTSVSRYLSVDLQKEDYTSANKTFNTAIVGLSAIFVLMLPVIIIVAYTVPRIFNVPIGQENDAVLLFLCVCAAFLIRSWSGNFTVQLFAYNRLDLQNIVNITNIFVQTGMIILLFYIFGPSLVLIGFAYLFGAISASAISIALAKKVCPNLYISMGLFDLSRLKALCSMGWWVVVNQIGSLLFLQIDLIIINILLGAASAGEYAIVLQWIVLLRGVADMTSGILTPMIFTYYARVQIDTLIKMVNMGIIFMGLLMALPIGLICGFAPHILTIWVGEKYVFLVPLMVIMIFHLTINLAILPLFSINVAYNKIRVPGIVTLIMGIVNILLAVILTVIIDWGFYGVAIAGAIILTLKNAIFTPWYAAKVIGTKARRFIESMLPGIIMAIILSISASLIGMFISHNSILLLALIGCIIVLTYVIIIWKIIFSNFERELIGAYLPDRIRRIIL